MNAQNLAKLAYSQSSTPVRTDRGNEYDTFVRVTRQLKLSDPNANYPEFIRALYENRKLWTALAIDVAGADNKLSQQLRAQIFYLAEFTTEHTSRVIAGGADAVALVDINTSIMRGLFQNGAAK